MAPPLTRGSSSFKFNACYEAMQRCFKRPFSSSRSYRAEGGEAAQGLLEAANDTPTYRDLPYNLPQKFSDIENPELRAAARYVLGLNYWRLVPSLVLAFFTACSYYAVASKEDVSLLASFLTSFVNFIFYTALYPDWVRSIQLTFTMLPIIAALQKENFAHGKNFWRWVAAILRVFAFFVYTGACAALFIIAATNAFPIMLALMRERETAEITCPLMTGIYRVKENDISPCWINQFASLMLIFAEAVTAAPDMIAKTLDVFIQALGRWWSKKTDPTTDKAYYTDLWALTERLKEIKKNIQENLKDYHRDYKAYKQSKKQGLEAPEPLAPDFLPYAKHLFAHYDPKTQGLKKLMLAAATVHHGVDRNATGEKEKESLLIRMMAWLNYYIFGYVGSLFLNFSFAPAGFVALSQALPQLFVDLLGEGNFLSEALFAMLLAPAIVQLVCMIIAILPDIFLLGGLAAKFAPTLLESMEDTLVKERLWKKIKDFILYAGILVVCLFSTVGMTAGTNESVAISKMNHENSTIIHNQYLDTATRVLLGYDIAGETPFTHHVYLGTLITIAVGTALNAYAFLKLLNALSTCFKRSLQYFPFVNRPVERIEDEAEQKKRNSLLVGALLMRLLELLIEKLQSAVCVLHLEHSLEYPLPLKDGLEESAVKKAAQDAYQEARESFDGQLDQNLQTEVPPEHKIPYDTAIKSYATMVFYTLGLMTPPDGNGHAEAAEAVPDASDSNGDGMGASPAHASKSNSMPWAAASRSGSGKSRLGSYMEVQGGLDEDGHEIAVD